MHRNMETYRKPPPVFFSSKYSLIFLLQQNILSCVSFIKASFHKTVFRKTSRETSCVSNNTRDFHFNHSPIPPLFQTPYHYLTSPSDLLVSLFPLQKRAGLQEMTAKWDKLGYIKRRQSTPYQCWTRQHNRRKIPKAGKRVKYSHAPTIRSSTVNIKLKHLIREPATYPCRLQGCCFSLCEPI